MIDAFREFFFPGEDVGYAKVSALRLGLEEFDLFFDRECDLFVPARVEVFQEFTGLVYANKKAGEKAGRYGEGGQAMPQSIVTVDEGTEVLAIAGAHLPVGAEEFLQPIMERLIAGIAFDDAGGVAELIIESHVGL